jgi:serine/threonine protein kinase
MAPEIAKELEYTKCVDIWAIGIIMHYVITGGKHPFYNPKYDDSQILKKRLMGMTKTHEKIDPHSSLSWVAKNLFKRLTMIVGYKRYTAKDALKHPWITRNKQDKIPESLMDQLSQIEIDQNLKQKMQIAFFLNII